MRAPTWSFLRAAIFTVLSIAAGRAPAMADGYFAGKTITILVGVGAGGTVDTLTRGLALELAQDGVRVHAIRPGLIETEIHASGGEPDRAVTLGATTPMGRAGQAAEVAQAILWLIGEEASYVTGALLDVAGGR